jgi:hypothetical protein
VVLCCTPSATRSWLLSWPLLSNLLHPRRNF